MNGAEGQAGSSSAGSAPSRIASTSLSASLAAHLNRPTAPSTAASSVTADATTTTSHPPRIVGQSSPGKAAAVTTEVHSLAANGDVWKSNAARKAEKLWAIQSERTLQDDAKFKKYMLAIDKSLATFESVSEWADFIAFLGRLLRTLQSGTQFNAIPRKYTVAKRLSQCLNPALPSGVHQRALEVYEHILTVIGPEGLRRDLAIWTPGLLPFFQYASTTVKPIVLNLIEVYYLPLGQDLRPIAKPLELALLPGLEEETAEHFERVLKLLDKVQDSIDQPFFLQNLWLILISVASARLSALHYLTRRLPDLNGGQGSVTSIVGPDLGLTIRAFSATLEDDTILVQRAMLDILAIKLKLDTKTFAEAVREEDRVRLVRSALTVVLRRDISLNRRLYAWLLGPSEEVAAQQEYFEQHAMRYARLALLSEFDTVDEGQTTLDRPRPYRILISLLDKWSLGLPITNALIIDAFKALQVHLDPALTMEQTSRTSTSDLSTTAKMLFEAVDPFALYRQFYFKISEELREEAKGDEETQDPIASSISLLRFITATFRVHDEESRMVHLPTLLATILELVADHPEGPHAFTALQLARDILNLIPKRVFGNRLSNDAISTTKSMQKTRSFFDHGADLYESTSVGADEAAKKYIGFQHAATIVALLDVCTRIPLRSSALAVDSLTILCQLLGILDATSESETTQPPIAWDAQAWCESMEGYLQDTHTFIELEACTEAFVACGQCRALSTPFSLQQSGMASVIVEKLFDYMQPISTPYHVRSVELLWTVVDLAPKTPLGSTLARRITASASLEREDALETFGVIWKYSEEARLARPMLTEPLLSLLDGLHATEWTERQATETWVRNHVRSFTALLDPLLLIICDEACHRVEEESQIDGHTIHFRRYLRPLDHERVRYALSLLLGLLHVGGQSFHRSLRSASVSSSPHRRLSAMAVDRADLSYAQLVMDQLLLLLTSDVAATSAYQAENEAIHSLVIDLIGSFIGKVHLNHAHLATVETILLQRLLVDVRSVVLNTQSKLLRTIHQLMASTREVPRNAPSSGTLAVPPPILLSAIKAGLSASTNRPVLQHWADFIMAIAHVFRFALSPLLLPINQGVCAMIRAGVAEMGVAYAVGVQEDATCATSDADLLILVAISERVLLQSLEQQASTGTADVVGNGATVTEKGEALSLLGALTSVFTTDTATSDNFGTSNSNAVWKSLHQTVMTLHLAWTSVGVAAVVEDARQEMMDVVRRNVQARCRRYMERLYRHHSGEVVEALIACWGLANRAQNTEGAKAAFEILAFLAPSAQIVVTFLCDVISTRTSSTVSISEKAALSGTSSIATGAAGTSKNMSSPGLPDAMLLAFLEAYLQRLEAEGMVQVWPVLSLFVKDILGNSVQHKAQIFPTLRCLTIVVRGVLDERKSTTTATTNQAGKGGAMAAVQVDDRRLKRDLIDLYTRICDLAILIGGRTFEQTSWIGRRTVAPDPEAMDAGTGDQTVQDEKLAGSIGDLSSSSLTLAESIQVYLAHDVLPVLSTFSLDGDKLVALSTNVVYYIVAPALRGRRKPHEISPTTTTLLLELTKLSGTYKTWRTAVAEFFGDARFFDMPSSMATAWMPIVLAVMNGDKERFIETIGRISTPSTNIFTNREAETRTRALNLRRMAYVLFAAPKDHWLTQLPLIQEKLVDLLRSGVADPAVREVYLCLRVLLVRFDSRHLGGLWPIVITEMMRLFESCLDELPADGSDALALVEAACRFLDLLITLQTGEFQIHQWLFITDTVDVVYPPDDWSPESILDRLAVAIDAKRREHPASTRRTGTHAAHGLSHRASAATLRTTGTASMESRQGEQLAGNAASKRRPVLMDETSSSDPDTTAIHTIEDLQPFFANVSLHAFESTYASGDAIDWDAIERMLLHALFPHPLSEE